MAPWSWAIDNFESREAQVTEADRVRVVPCFYQEKKVQREITTKRKNFVDFVVQRLNVKQTKGYREPLGLVVAFGALKRS